MLQTLEVISVATLVAARQDIPPSIRKRDHVVNLDVISISPGLAIIRTLPIAKGRCAFVVLRHVRAVTLQDNLPGIAFTRLRDPVRKLVAIVPVVGAEGGDNQASKHFLGAGSTWYSSLLRGQ